MPKDMYYFMQHMYDLWYSLFFISLLDAFSKIVKHNEKTLKNKNSKFRKL